MLVGDIVKIERGHINPVLKNLFFNCLTETKELEMSYVRVVRSLVSMFLPLVLGLIAGILMAEGSSWLSVLFIVPAAVGFMYNYRKMKTWGIQLGQATIPLVDCELTGEDLKSAKALLFDNRRGLWPDVSYVKKAEFTFQDGWIVLVQDPRLMASPTGSFRVFFTKSRIASETIQFETVKKGGIFQMRTKAA